MATKPYGELATRHGMTKYNISNAKTAHFYILDAIDDIVDEIPAPGRAGKFGVESIHHQKTKNVYDLVNKNFDCELHIVNFPPRSKPNVVFKYFEEELQGKGEDDLMIIYYHGGAGFNGEDYTWKFEQGFPKREIDAFEIIKLFTDSGIDTMFILDAFIPSRFASKYLLHGKDGEDSENSANVEIIARGCQMQRPDGTVLEGGKDDFTSNVCADLDRFVRLIDVPGKQGGFQGHKAPKSIPILLRSNKNLTDNPRRIWLKRIRMGGEESVSRMVMVPADIRKTGKISWFLKHIQGDKAMPDADAPIVPPTLKIVEEDEDEGIFVDDDEDENGGTSPIGAGRLLTPSVSGCD